MANSKVLTLNFPDDTPVTLCYEDGADVVHANDDYYDYVYNSTGVFETASTVVTSLYFPNNRVLESLRDNDLLEGYERGSYNFENFVCETMRECNFDLEFVEGTLEQYDYKRAYYRIKFNFPVTLGQLKRAIRDDVRAVAPLEVIVHTDLGDLTVN